MPDHKGLEADDHTCKFCHSNLQGKPIPTEHRNSYGNATHFSRVIGIEYGHKSKYHYDGVSEWRCPDCAARTNRWTGELLGPLDAATRNGNVRLTDEVS